MGRLDPDETDSWLQRASRGSLRLSPSWLQWIGAGLKRIVSAITPSTLAGFNLLFLFAFPLLIAGWFGLGPTPGVETTNWSFHEWINAAGMTGLIGVYTCYIIGIFQYEEINSSHSDAVPASVLLCLGGFVVSVLLASHVYVFPENYLGYHEQAVQKRFQSIEDGMEHIYASRQPFRVGTLARHNGIRNDNCDGLLQPSDDGFVCGDKPDYKFRLKLGSNSYKTRLNTMSHGVILRLNIEKSHYRRLKKQLRKGPTAFRGYQFIGPFKGEGHGHGYFILPKSHLKSATSS